MANIYVTQHGNVENDGTSWDKSKRSVQSALDLGLSTNNANFVLAKGFFRERIAHSGLYGHLKGISPKETIFDGTLLSGYFRTHNHGTLNWNYTVQNFEQFVNNVHISNGNYQDLVIRKITKTVGRFSTQFKRNIISNSARIDFGASNQIMELLSNTIYNVPMLVMSDVNPDNTSRGSNHSNLFSACNIYITSNLLPKFLNFSMFHNCNFRIGSGETEYTPATGANDVEKMDNIRQRLVDVFGGVKEDYFVDCKYQTDGDMFLDVSRENFSLVKGCPASKMSYIGQWVGKYPESDFQVVSGFESVTNIDANGKVIDIVQDATAETTIIDFGKLRHVDGFKALGERGMRNGNSIGETNIGLQINPGTALIDGKTYIVRAEAITQTLSGKTRDVGETFIATVADGLEFTNSLDGYVQEVFTDKMDAFIEIKASKIDPTLATAVWMKFKLSGEPYVNYDVNGVAQYGNADIDFNDVTKEKFFARYIKARITIKAKNLPA